MPTAKSTPQPLEVLQVPGAQLTLATTCAVTGLSASTLYRLARRGELVPVRHSTRCSRWPADAVRAWMAGAR